MEGEKVDQAPGSCERKWNLHDFVDHSCVSYRGMSIPPQLLTYASSAPKDQVSRAAKMLAEEFVSALS